MDDAWGSGYIVASGGKIVEHIEQQWLLRDSLDCNTEPYALDSSALSNDGMMPNAARLVGEAGSDVEYLRGEGGLYEVVDVMCVITRGVSGCDDGNDEVVFGRGKRLVGDTDRVVRGSGFVSEGPRLGGRRSGDVSLLTYVCDHLSETSALLLFPAFHRTTGSMSRKVCQSYFSLRETSQA